MVKAKQSLKQEHSNLDTNPKREMLVIHSINLYLAFDSSEIHQCLFIKDLILSTGSY